MAGKPRHPKPTREQIAGRALRKAAEVMEDRGWVKGNMGNPQTGFCVMGAINFAHTGSQNYANATSISTQGIFSKWLRETLQPAPDSIPFWNDHKAGGKEEVVAVMRKAADDLDPQTW